jgi:hypothetical protein
MIGAHADPSDIVGDVIDAVWNSAAQFGIDTPVGGEPASVSHSLVWDLPRQPCASANCAGLFPPVDMALSKQR